MARTKQTANKAEQKQIAAIVNSHPDKLASVEWLFTDEGACWVATFAEGVELDPMEGDDLEQLLADAVDAAAEMLARQGEDEGLDDDSEGEAIKTIVPHKYRNEYKARGDARSCGDWLALTLRDLLNGGSKKNPVDLEKTYALAEANGCTKRWDHLNPGQQRMNAGNAIRRQVKAVGYLVVPAELSSDGTEQKLYP
jgi:hypothetical protein